MSKRSILASVLILLFLSFSNFNYINTYIYAQNLSNFSQNLPNTIYYDADGEINANRETGYIELNDNATFLLGNLYITAKKIIILKLQNIITAEGNVKLIYKNEKATASKIVFDANTKQLRMDDAQVFSDPSSIEDKMSKEALGLSKAELAFNKDKVTRAAEIEQQLKSLRDNYTNLKNLQEIKKNDPKIDEKINSLVVRYGQLLARYSRTQYQPNAYLAAIPEQDQERFLKRREAVSN